MQNKLEVGKWNKLPHYSVIGSPADFYVWINEDGYGTNSTWIKGDSNLYHTLKNSLKSKDKFISLVKEVYKKNKK